MPINILVTGADGQLGNCIRDLQSAFPDNRFFFTDIGELDITDAVAVDEFILGNKIECVINAAAYTAVDKAEDEPEKANLINGEAVAVLARAVKRAGGLLVHVSTDYIFDGNTNRPLTEEAKPSPISAYAYSKWLGEEMIAKENPSSVVLRTSWLYSEYGHNFVKTMMRLGGERDVLKVVYDQVGTPTYAGDLARVILELLPRWLEKPISETYHYSDEGVASWYDFAVAALDLAGISCKVLPIETKDYPLPARRPFYSLMSKEKIKKQFDISIPHWRESLKICVNKLI